MKRGKTVPLDDLKQTPFLSPATEDGRKAMHEFLQKAYPRIEYSRIGRSVCGRDILSYKIGNGGGRVAFFGAHHALESITANVLYAFIYIMLAGDKRYFGGGCTVSHLLSLYTYYVIPCVNPDGIELRFKGESSSPIAYRFKQMSESFPVWQANERGVDINHNYGYGFEEYKRIEHERLITAGPTLYSGEYPESEPESHAVAAFVRALGPTAVLSLHSQGEEIYFSPPDASIAAKRLSELTGYSLAIPSGTAAYGGLCDYTGGALSIPSFTIEVGRGKNPLREASVPYILRQIARALLLLPTFV